MQRPPTDFAHLKGGDPATPPAVLPHRLPRRSSPTARVHRHPATTTAAPGEDAAGTGASGRRPGATFEAVLGAGGRAAPPCLELSGLVEEGGCGQAGREGADLEPGCGVRAPGTLGCSQEEAGGRNLEMRPLLSPPTLPPPGARGIVLGPGRCASPSFKESRWSWVGGWGGGSRSIHRGRSGNVATA